MQKLLTELSSGFEGMVQVQVEVHALKKKTFYVLMTNAGNGQAADSAGSDVTTETLCVLVAVSFLLYDHLAFCRWRHADLQYIQLSFIVFQLN